MLKEAVKSITGGFLEGIGATPFDAIRQRVVDTYKKRAAAVNHELQRALRRAYLQATIALCEEGLRQAKPEQPTHLWDKLRGLVKPDADEEPFLRIIESLEG